MACPPRETFQIGWICALPIEAAAAMEMLDEDFGPLDSQDMSDSNTYTLGRIGKHYVVIACLPAGQYGNNAATTVANNMVRTFSTSLRVGLMVGVGGGIPSTAHDIRLGDVVISCPERTVGGVVQYDMGKVGLDGGFYRNRSLNSPPRSPLTAVSSMRAAELRDDPRFPEYLANATRRTTRTRKNFSRPNLEQDRLFKPEHDHPVTINSYDGCPAEWEEIRSKRESSDPQPHYGIIASGNSVIKHVGTREKLRLATGALCFEMEAAGLMQDFPCIVIRGVCDYADSHKNKQWQGYAALAAASYAKELLGYIPVAYVSQESLVVDVCSIDELKDEIKGTNKRLDRAYNQHWTDRQRRCHQAFKISNYEEQKNINPTRVKGTCQWALQNPEYIRWWESTYNDLLWVSADPGCGKSVLARSIIDDVQASSPVTMCFFFFKDNDEQNHLATALCSILHQLFSQRPYLLHHAIPSWEKNGERLQQEVDELWRIFTAAALADVSHNTICIFDALDECREMDQGQLIEKLQTFYCQPSTKDTRLKILVTSRPYDHIQDHFRAITDSFPHIHIKGEEENDQIGEEIDLVVKIRVRELAETVPLSLDVYQRVQQQLLQMENRTYLWLHLAIDDIRTTFKRSLRPTESSITLIPPSVNAAYEKILSRVPVDQTDIVKKVLEIIVAARRPLTIREMAMALGIATCLGPRTTIQAGLDPIDLDEKLRQLCGLFVFTNHSKFYLIHQTAREFLIEKKRLNILNFAYWSSLSDAEDLMAEICLRYLLMEDLKDCEGKSGSNIRNLLEYSAGGRYGNALQAACSKGHDNTVQILLECGADVNAQGGLYRNALQAACSEGHDNTVQLLLECGANVNAQGGLYGSALQAACSEGHYNTVQLLLEHGADVNSQGGLYATALQAAHSKGHDEIAPLQEVQDFVRLPNSDFHAMLSVPAFQTCSF
ncbi:hypothetical protein PENARI_c007G07930 [Penicillium arizonense]|uniref:Uncharacterized protein n=1 Tax=Penicillium arizonense TaxID=1835702 RepID=A0A1F5LL69_PENAI|nr:hypothetical protein PENARI_c007G07930 [Penicillium arizonense]OGE53750.1 hypothetical protein PENARI_c007G07930 [Penicillium arizonense]